MFGFETLNRGDGSCRLTCVVCIVDWTISSGLLCDIVESSVLKKSWLVGSHFAKRGERRGERVEMGDERWSGEKRDVNKKKEVGVAL